MSHVDDGTLHAYLDGELPPEERARLESHVGECPACRSRLEEERGLVERAGQLLGLAQPVERPAPPMHQLRRPRLVWRLRVPLAWAASLVVAVGLGYYAGGTAVAPASRQVAAEEALTDSFAPASRVDGFQRFQERDAPAEPAAPRRAANRVDSTAAKARSESLDLVAGVVTAEAEAPLRVVTPTPVPSAAITTSRPSADLAGERGRLVTTEWPIIRAGPARELLGADPVGVPGLTVRSLRRSPTGDVVLVEQTIDSATVIQIFQERTETDRLYFEQRAAAPQSAAPAAAPRLARAATERLARFIGGLRVEITGPLSTDSLNRLLEQVKPIKP